MKIMLSILFITSIVVSCRDEHHATEPSIAKTEQYDLNKDTTVYTQEMKRFWLVLLQIGPNRNQDSISAEKIQAAHMANINRLAKDGKIIMAGPIGVEGDLRGIFLMNCADSTEVENFVKTDSAVITGRLIMKYYPWWTAKGKYVFK